MKKTFGFLGKVILNLDAIITCLTLSACTILVNANIFTRYLFSTPIYWAEEVATSLFIWTVFIGSAYAFRIKAHLGECARGEGEKYKVSWKTQSRSIFDHKKFVADHPGMDVSKYYKTSNSRPFKVTEKKGI